MRVVIKVGTSTLAYENTGLLHIRRMKQLCEVLSDIKNAGHEVILVSSGAIGKGMGKLGLDSKPHDLPGKQACAAIGQCELMYTYDSLFSQYNHIVGQILITKADVENDDRKTNFINTMELKTDHSTYDIYDAINGPYFVKVHFFQVGIMYLRLC